MPHIEFHRYYRYVELTELLRAFAAEFPNLVQLESIGQSHEGKEIWLVTVTNSGTGKAAHKPAFWCDGNIHASETSASTAVLYLLNKLCTQYGKDETITRALDTRAFYLVPRLNPDGAEWALEDIPRIVRSGTRAYPFEEEDPYGLERQDVDGDGRILNMRIPDPHGAWKISEEEPRLLKRREAGEVGGTYYRLMPEGLFHNFDGLTMRGRKIPQGLDFNRNFPSAWRQEHEQYGAGDFPTSEPEIRAAVAAIVARPNICGAVTFHTFSGVHLRPPSRMADDDIPAEDLWAYQTIGAKGQEMTGYPAISNYHEFRYHPKEVITGVFDDWMYEHRGVFAWTTELWSPQREAGITDYKYIEWFREHPFEHDIQMLKWSDEKLDGVAHVDWYEFDHPQLGKIELGGWNSLEAFRNPPPKFLESEVAKHSDWVVWQALVSPKLEHRETIVEPCGDGAWRIRVAVYNSGYLPTNVSEIAKKRSLARGVMAEIRRDGEEWPGIGTTAPRWLVAGRLRETGPHLVGWSHVSAGGFGWQMNGTDDMAVFEWVVSQPGLYQVVAWADRAGRIETQIRV
ncbi:MAG: carboxypeptidase [Armatimonadetes bacterium]|nr:carboxypeptidase [Armatimonadota bacterium]